MSLLATSLWHLLHGLVAVAIPAACGFGLGVCWANARRTRWRQRARQLQAERDALLATLDQSTAATEELNEQLGALARRLERLRTDGVAAPDPRRPNLHVIRTGGVR